MPHFRILELISFPLLTVSFPCLDFMLIQNQHFHFFTSDSDSLNLSSYFYSANSTPRSLLDFIIANLPLPLLRRNIHPLFILLLRLYHHLGDLFGDRDQLYFSLLFYHCSSLLHHLRQCFKESDAFLLVFMAVHRVNIIASLLVDYKALLP